MRQRVKLAQALAHDPEVLVLDEPLSGMDPVWRRRVMDLLKGLGDRGAAVVVSSHILHEVESMTDTFVLLFQGRVRASGSRGEIRAYLSDVPHRIRLGSPRPRDLARALIELPGVLGLRLDDGGLSVETTAPESLFDALPRLVLDAGLPVDELREEDTDLDSIFGYLVA
jgi:ABC-2 type transport system ATP-binding protein